ncbi:hypothetical protein CK203_106562 [Vitis vinifera]|uniref:Uncharacterized protein n=1 Tax=Vitis vinifera TaxID=29760 RepID=A0A438DVA5_VITVI|nr:hypothetical protein CK203_106562 [Vitis vinifera]
MPTETIKLFDSAEEKMKAKTEVQSPSFQGIHCNKEGNGLCWNSSDEQEGISELLLQLYFIHFSLGLETVGEILAV